MNALFRIFVICAFLTSGLQTAFTQELPDTFEMPLVGAEYLSHAILLEVYTPMTHYKQGNASVTVNPVYCDISQLLVDNTLTLTGDDLKGYAMGLVCNLAVTDRYYITFMTSIVKFNGSIIMTESSSHTELGSPYTYELEGELSNQLFVVGIGSDLSSSIFSGDSKWSIYIPVGFYINNLHYNMEGTSPDNLNPDLDISDSSSKAGFFVTLVLSRKFNILGLDGSAAPFFMIMGPSKKQTIQATVTDGNGTGFMDGEIVEFGGEYGTDAFYPGLKLIIYTGSYLSFSLNLSGFFGNFTNVYNDLYMRDLEMKTISVGITYRNY